MNWHSIQALVGSENTLQDTFGKTHRIYNTRSETSCNLWTLDDSNLSK